MFAGTVESLPEAEIENLAVTKEVTSEVFLTAPSSFQVNSDETPVKLMDQELEGDTKLEPNYKYLPDLILIASLVSV